MTDSIEIIERQDRRWLTKIYGLRRIAFPEFPKGDQMVRSIWDALSRHYLLLSSGNIAGAVSTVDLTGQNDVLQERGIDISLKVLRVTKLAVLPGYRGYQRLNRLLTPLKKEVNGYDFVCAELAPPSDRIEDQSRFGLARIYERIGGLKPHRLTTIDGVPTLILGRFFSQPNNC
jgi:hypothetical protein